ncbi:PilZ domain-containing protein [Candidatus Manganitrophus noduliformans]|uniref:hydroxymethylglutaryl-CoA reductase (NADPH) n=1 Tax=Candidatus Manganitrophus noduliformans TaxID=2606439 RepID=A0A7X6DS88_9BACT|nr:PilZ domain-containing protein [Candidatus Manganitrophus noduliformans]NKE72447.1 hypothetical protein [Candidatus Manganitrophus noduliformans]
MELKYEVSFMKHPDRRSYFRAKEIVPISIIFRDREMKKEKRIKGEALDIGLTGLSISTEKALPQTEKGVIEISLPNPFNPIKARIRIKWRNDQKHAYGLEFYQSENGDLNSWDEFVKGSSNAAIPDRRQKEEGRKRNSDGLSRPFKNDEKRKIIRRITDLIESENTDLFHTGKRSDITTLDLIPNRKDANYTNDTAAARRKWLELKTGVKLENVSVFSDCPENMKGNIENFIGVSQIPIGIAGPLKINGKFAKGNFYVPMATTEGALVYTYTQGMQILSLAGGVNTAVLKDELHISSIFTFKNISEALNFKKWLLANFERIKTHADGTTRHGKLIRIEPIIFDRNVTVKFYYSTADASGVNMVTFATDAACKFISSIVKPAKFFIQSNYSSIKKVTAHNFISGYGKSLIAECVIPRKLVKRTFNVWPETMVDYFRLVLLSTTHAAMIGMNGHVANGLAAIFLACGQDVASVVESHASVINYEITEKGDLYASIKLPCLVIGTVGGGVGLGTQRECLELMGCFGHGHAKKFAEIIAATTLGGEIAICARIANGTFVEGHKKYGRKTGPQVDRSLALLHSNGHDEQS